MCVCTYHPSYGEVKTGDWGIRLHREFRASLGYMRLREKACV